MRILSFFTFFCVYWTASISFAQTQEKKPRIVTINIGFDCKDYCPPMGGIENDLAIYDQISKAAGSLFTITITNAQLAKMQNKQELIDLLKKRTAEYDTVIFNYSGHGMPFPKDPKNADKRFTENSDSKDYDFLFGNEFYAKCIGEVDDRPLIACKKNCEIVNDLNKCTPFYNSHTKKCEGKSPFAAWKKCWLNVPKDKKVEFEFCSDLNNKKSTCQTDCQTKLGHNTRRVYGEFISVSEPYSPEKKKCLDQYGLLASDFEPVFKDKKLYALIDACHSGLMQNFDHPDAVIAMSSSAFELSKSSRQKKIGFFTDTKKDLLDETYCKYANPNTKAVTLTDLYLTKPNLRKDGMTPEVRTTGASDQVIELKGYYHCEPTSPGRTVTTPARETHAQ